MDPSKLSHQEDFIDDFDPDLYLQRYKDLEKYQHVLERLHELYSTGVKGKILELGCGPVLNYQISAAPHASEIVMADLSERNRDTLRLWLDKSPKAYDWRPHIRYVVHTLEGKEGEEEVAKREEQMRRVIKTVIPCDVTKDPPVPPGYEGPYDVVLESATLDSACHDEASYFAALLRLSKLVKPGGTFVSKTWLVEGASLPVRTYAVGGKAFSSVNVSGKMLLEGLGRAGFSDIKYKKPPSFKFEPPHQLAGAEYAGGVIVTAVKTE